MNTSVNAAPAVRAALAALVDYAGLFPPAQLAMPQALAEYAESKRGAFAWMLGRFIVPASRIGEMLDRDAGPLAVSVILDAGADPRAWLSAVQGALARTAELRRDEPRLAIEALEVPLAPLLTQRDTHDAAIGQFAASARQAGLGDVPVFVEAPRDERWEAQLPGTMFALARHRLGAKLRCGGVTAQAFPSPAQVAHFLQAAASEQVPFKATAGLHHPVRGLNEASGFVMHGFLNLLAGACLAAGGADFDELESAIADEDATHFGLEQSGLRWNDRRVAAGELETARRRGLVAYGSCSFTEPVDDLRALGILK